MKLWAVIRKSYTEQVRFCNCRPAASCDETSTLVDAALHHAEHAIASSVVDQRTHLGCRVSRIADLRGRRECSEPLDEVVVEVLVDDAVGCEEVLPRDDRRVAGAEAVVLGAGVGAALTAPCRVIENAPCDGSFGPPLRTTST